MPTHKITNANDVRTGNAQSADRTKNGVPLTGDEAQSVLVLSLGAPAAASANGAAASQTVTGAGTAFVLNGALASGGVVTFDKPRNVVAAWTNTAIITITGRDVYGQRMTEVSASGTSHTGLKAFKYIDSITTSATITAATVGTGIALGLPYRPVVGGFIRARVNEDTSDVSVYVAPSRVTATSTTGDVRGTIQPASGATLNGTNVITVVAAFTNGPEDADAFGVTQA
jgi:hypothetical protein